MWKYAFSLPVLICAIITWVVLDLFSNQFALICPDAIPDNSYVGLRHSSFSLRCLVAGRRNINSEIASNKYNSLQAMKCCRLNRESLAYCHFLLNFADLIKEGSD